MHIHATTRMFLCMRTTIELTDELFRRAKNRAADDGVALRDVVEAALRSYLSGRPKASRYELNWRTEGGRLQPGVDLDDRDALFDRMGGRE